MSRMLRQKPANVFLMSFDGTKLQDEDVGSGGGYLRNVHHRVTAQRSCRGQVVETQQRRDDSVLIDSADHGAVHEENSAVFVHGYS